MPNTPKKPNITKKDIPPPNAAEWDGVPNKYPEHFSEKSGTCNEEETGHRPRATRDRTLEGER